mgnify:CR=1 FL=1
MVNLILLHAEVVIIGKDNWEHPTLRLGNHVLACRDRDNEILVTCGPFVDIRLPKDSREFKQLSKKILSTLSTSEPLERIKA